MRSVRGRMVGVMLAVALASAAVTFWITSRETTREATRSVVADEAETEDIYGTISYFAFVNGDWSEVQPLVDQLATLFDERIALTDIEGHLLADSDPGAELPTAPAGFIDPANPAISFDDPILLEEEFEGLVGVLDLQAEVDALTAFLDTNGIPYVLEPDEFGLEFPHWDEDDDHANELVEEFYEDRIDLDSDRIAPEALLFLGYPTDATTVAVPIGSRQVLALVGIGLLTVLAAVVAARRVASPIASLTTAARAMGDGDLSQRVEVVGEDEIASLAHSFNAMADSVETQDRLRRTMTGDVAHELRTPLSNIRGYLEAIQEGVAQPDDPTIASIHEEALHLEMLVDDLQQLTLAEAGVLRLDRSEVDLASVAAAVVEGSEARAASSGVALEREIAEVPSVSGDASRLRQVVANLVDNALRHTGAGGRVRVAVSGSDVVSITVADDGEGIPAEHLPHVFDRFYRVDSSRNRGTGGTGLGLAIVREIVRLHEGDVTVESEVGVGTTFSVRIPVSR